MYCSHNEHDEVYDKYMDGWYIVSHHDIEKNKKRYVYAGEVFTSPKTGKSWQYYRKGNELKVKPYNKTN